MSQRVKNINEEVSVVIKLDVSVERLSNHNGFKDGQVDKAVEEFKELIVEEIKSKVKGLHQSEEFLSTVDFVTYMVK